MEENKTEIPEAKKTKYLRKDIYNGYIDDENEAIAFSLGQELDVMEFGLLGDYSKNGVYSIENEIIKELVNCKKRICGNYGELIFAKSERQFEGNCLDFSIKIEYDDDAGSAVAYLNLLEQTSRVNGLITNTITTSLAQYKNIKSINFKDQTMTAFNLLPADAPRTHADGLKDELIFALERKKYLALFFESSKEILDENIEKLFYAKLKAIKGVKGGAEFIDLFKMRLSQLNLNELEKTNLKKDYKALNQMLDAVLESQPKNKSAEINEILKKSAEKTASDILQFKKAIKECKKNFIKSQSTESLQMAAEKLFKRQSKVAVLVLSVQPKLMQNNGKTPILPDGKKNGQVQLLSHSEERSSAIKTANIKMVKDGLKKPTKENSVPGLRQPTETTKSGASKKPEPKGKTPQVKDKKPNKGKDQGKSPDKKPTNKGKGQGKSQGKSQGKKPNNKGTGQGKPSKPTPKSPQPTKIPTATRPKPSQTPHSELLREQIEQRLNNLGKSREKIVITREQYHIIQEKKREVASYTTKELQYKIASHQIQSQKEQMLNKSPEDYSKER